MTGDWLGAAVAAIAVLAGLGSAATFVALGTQRGRVTRLESTNDDLRQEVEDEKRRHDATRADLEAANATADRDRAVIEHLQEEVRVMRDVFAAVNGPIAALTLAVNADHDLLAGHHKEAMNGLELVYAMLADLMRMGGDERSPATLIGALRPKERGSPGAEPTAG